MRPIAWLAVLGACGDGGDPTGTTPTPSPCASVVAIDAVEGPLPLLREVTAEFDVSAPAALACVRDGDPAEALLLEHPEPATSHRFEVAGFAADSTWTCRVAPECAGSRAGEVAVAVDPGAAPALRPSPGDGTPWEPAYTLASWMPGGGCGGVHELVVWDPDGAPRWEYPLPRGVGIDVEALPDGLGNVAWGGGGSADGAPQRVDLWGRVVDRVDFPGAATSTFHHDGKWLPDGRFLTLDVRPNALGPAAWDGFGLRLATAGGDVSWDYDSQRAVDAGALPAGIGDAWHANWADLVVEPDGEHALVSLCYLGRILDIRVSDHEVAWAFGAGLGWTLQDADGAPLTDDALPQCQHGLEFDGARLLVYDNGTSRGYTQAVEWALDPATRTATRTWSWAGEGWFERTMGDVDRLDGGGVVVTQAHPGCWSPEGDRSAIVGLDPDSGAVRGRLDFPEPTDAVYRSERVPVCAWFADTRFCAAAASRYAWLHGEFGL